MAVVLRPPVLRPGRTVEHRGGSATVIGLERVELWIFGRPRLTTWVLVEFVDGRRRHVRPEELEAPELEAPR